MFASWNDMMLPVFLNSEEWNYCRSVFDKGEKGIATEEEISKVNELLAKNEKGFTSNISNEEFKKLEEQERKEMQKKGLI